MSIIRDAANGLYPGLTAPQFANDKDFATTEFVQRALGSHQSNLWCGSNTTLTAADMGKAIIIGTANITLPPIASVTRGASVKLMVTGAGGVLSVSGGANLIVGGTMNNIVASWALTDGDEAVCVSDGSSWLMFGTASLKNNAKFGSSLAINGYQKLPSGLIIQWGMDYGTYTAGVARTITMPLAFPNAMRSLALTAPNTNMNTILTCSWRSTSQFDITASTAVSGYGISWTAMGY